jgi:hypothetical protein
MGDALFLSGNRIRHDNREPPHYPEQLNDRQGQNFKTPAKQWQLIMQYPG